MFIAHLLLTPCTPACSASGVHSLVEVMLCLLEESGRSMKDMVTDTREQQREWWRARLALDDRLAALLQSLDKSWLSCWRSAGLLWTFCC
jgi:hypothetical protein